MTKVVFESLRQRILEVQDELGASAGQDPLSDRWKCGAIAGYTDLLNTTFGEVSNDD